MRGWFLNRDWKIFVDGKANWLVNLFIMIAVVIITNLFYNFFICSEQDSASVDVDLTILGLHISLLSIVIAVSAFFGFFSLEKAVRREVEEQLKQELTDAYKEEFLKKVHEDAKISEKKKLEIIAAKEPKEGN